MARKLTGRAAPLFISYSSLIFYNWEKRVKRFNNKSGGDAA
jgi:hypothetical protein